MDFMPPGGPPAGTVLDAVPEELEGEGEGGDGLFLLAAGAEGPDPPEPAGLETALLEAGWGWEDMVFPCCMGVMAFIMFCIMLCIGFMPPMGLPPPIGLIPPMLGIPVGTEHRFF